MIWATLDRHGILHLRDERTDRGERWALERARGINGQGVTVLQRECEHGHPTWLCAQGCVPLVGEG